MAEGLVYEGVQAEPMEFSGGSAAQSSLLHCFDELLGVKHEKKSGETEQLHFSTHCYILFLINVSVDMQQILLPMLI